MPDLETFEAEVKKNIKLLSSKDARTRRKAAAWLGEAGDPTAITALVQAYKNDQDGQVRENARYALGMFRALEEAWNEDQERVGQLLEDVALKGKMGRRPRIPTRGLVKAAISLLLSAAVVAGVALSGLLQPGGRSNANTPPPATETPDLSQTIAENTPTPETIAPTEIPTEAGPSPTPLPSHQHVDALQRIIDDMTAFRGPTTLLIQFWTEAQSSGTTVGCQEWRQSPPTIAADYALPQDIADALPNLKLAADLVNTGLKGMREGVNAFTTACNTGSPGIAAQDWLPRANLVVQAFEQAANLLVPLRG
ncbi:MAG: HEAT repeat domain-containing protein [Chloroflexi bacterium]|nr:HEAT repeat domain-containing protein [Chloroflexota bacterium]